VARLPENARALVESGVQIEVDSIGGVGSWEG
jgi:hypothetical protein